jgi:hypothetical protein
VDDFRDGLTTSGESERRFLKTEIRATALMSAKPTTVSTLLTEEPYQSKTGPKAGKIEK